MQSLERNGSEVTSAFRFLALRHQLFSLSLTLIFLNLWQQLARSYVRRVIANLARDIGDAVLFAYLSA